MNEWENQILDFFKLKTELSSGEIFELAQKPISKKASQVTIKRYLTNLTSKSYLEKIGKGRSVKYVLSSNGILLRPYDLQIYLKLSDSERGGERKFNFKIFNKLGAEIFSEKEILDLNEATEYFEKNKKEGSDTIHKKELYPVVAANWIRNCIL